MDSSTGSIGLIVILVLYTSIGFMAAAGSVFLTQKLFGPRLEQIFYAGFLIAVAAFYLAFADYFSAHDAWPLETSAVIVFSAFALVGLRFPLALVIGYPLHGLWDLVHEISAHLYPVFEPGRTTEVPLAYVVMERPRSAGRGSGVLAVILSATVLTSCIQNIVVPPERAKSEIGTRASGSNCGQGETVDIKLKTGKTARFRACEVTDTYIQSCETPSAWGAAGPPVKYMYNDIATITLVRNKEPCWTRGPLLVR